MDEKKRILKVIEVTDDKLVEQYKPIVKKKELNRQYQSNPIKKSLMTFANENVGEKFSINDLLR